MPELDFQPQTLLGIWQLPKERYLIRLNTLNYPLVVVVPTRIIRQGYVYTIDRKR